MAAHLGDELRQGDSLRLNLLFKLLLEISPHTRGKIIQEFVSISLTGIQENRRER